MGYLDSLLSFFHFTQDTDLVVATCIVLLLMRIIGGMMTSITKAFGKPSKPVPIMKTYGVRTMLAFEVCLIAVIFYYHMRVTGRLLPIQIIFWVTTMVSIPVTWFIGSTLLHVIF
ncbi:MAG: hypothetical protein VW268_00410 [Rhodospirillaceae bacterium]